MKHISTPKADVFFDGNYLVRILIHEKADLDREDMLVINDAKFQLVGENPYCVLFIPGAYATITREAREVSATPEVYRNAIAKAILAHSIAHRLIGNFFVKINTPPAPTQLFSGETAALAWLEKMVRRQSVAS